ncbi:TraG/TraD family protein, partial [Bifidobacterium margollesii]
LYAWASQHKFRPGEEHGSARWGEPRDMAPFTDPDPKRNLQFTRTEGLALDTHATRRNLNALVVGGSGSGKTRSYVMPNLLNASMNWVATDPKGELMRATAPALREADPKYRVRAFDLVDPASSCHFNPMAYINPDSPETSILQLVENLVTNTDGTKKDQGDPFWSKAERALLNALVAWTWFLADNPNLPAVCDMVADMEASEQDETKMSIIDARMAAAKELLDELAKGTPDWVGGMDRRQLDRIADGLRFAVSQYRTFLQGAGETKKSIIISVGVRLAPIQVRQIRDLLESDDIDLHAIGRERTAIYMIIPDTHATFNFLAAVFYQSLFETLIYDADHAEGGHLDIPLHCMLDEFANIGRIPNFERLIATIRSRGVSVSVVLQNIAQGKALYERQWETIEGNCDSMLFLGGSEQSTTEWISKRLGAETIDTRSVGESRGSTGSWSVNIQQSRRELLTPDEVARLDTDHCIYMLRGLPPFRSLKIDPGRPIARPKSTLRHAK